MDKELRILIIEDVPGDAELEEHELRKAGLVFTSKIVATREAFLKALEEFFPDLILSDYDLPSFDGLAALRIAKEKCPDVPFILVTGKLGEEFAIEKLKEGAMDYVLKGNLKRLGPSVKRALEEAKMIAERKHLKDMMNLRFDLMEYAGTHSLEELLQKTLDEIGALTDSPIGFYHFVEPDQKTLSLQAWSTRTVKEFCTAKGKGMHYGIDQAGVWVDCVHERRPVIHNDYLSLPHRKGLPEGHAAVIRELVVPIIHEDNIVAILGIGNKPSDYTEKDVELVSFIADVAWGIAKRKRAEQELRESERNLKTAQKIAHVGSWDWDVVTGNLTWSDETYRIYGFEPQEFVPTYEKFLSVLHPDDHERAQKQVDAALSGEAEYNVDFRFVLPDGKIGWIFCNGEVTRDEQCKPLRFFGTQIDITERKRAEEALATQARIVTIFATVPDDEMFNEVLKVILDVMHSPFGVFGYIDEDGASVIPTMTRQVWDKCQILGKMIRFPRETWGDSTWARALREKRIIPSNEPSVNIPEGHVSIQRHISMPILFQGEAIGLLQVANKETDYTEADLRTLEAIASQVSPLLSARLRRERVEEVLRQSEMNLSEAQKIAHVGSWTYDINTSKVSWSEEMFRIFGINPEAGAPSWPEDYKKLFHPEDWERATEEIAKATNEGLSYEFTDRFFRPDGSIGYLSVIGKAICGEDGKPVKLIGTVQDITERKQAEKELNYLSEELKRSNADLEQFAYSASHDLQEPLSGIEGFVKLLSKRYKGKFDAKGNEFIEFTIEGVQRMKMLIKDLLEYSQIGTKNKNFTLIDSSMPLALALANLQRSIGKNKAVVTYDALPKVLADSSELSRLFQNLIGNGIKFHGNKLPKIHISAELKGKEWIFSVSDNGIGIDHKNFDRIFTVFQRLHNREEYEGTGIGLANCKKIVERHGGRIWVESEFGKGTTFYFTLPYQEITIKN